MRGLKDKVVVVTGSGRGIGRAIALRLAEEGAKVTLAEINQENAEQVAGEIRQSGGQALVAPVDITDWDAVQAMVARVERELGPIDALVNNAGWDTAERFAESNLETWKKVIDINLWGPLYCARAIVPGMIARGAGKIVNVGSDAGRTGSSGEAVYSACKGGIIAFTKTLARETARQGLNINCVCPGPTDTPLIQVFEPRLVAALGKAIPMGRVGQPDEVAPAVVFFCSDDARFITGQTLSVSGGLTMM